MSLVKNIAAGAALSLAATAASAVPVKWSGNNHYYEVVYSSSTFSSALAGAAASTYMGVAGSLVTITSWSELNFVKNTFGTSTKFWVGASDAASEGNWVWVSGTEAGQAMGTSMYSAWVGGSPDAAFANKDYAFLNAVPGLFNTASGAKVLGAYIVEYAGVTLPAVPVPAGLPLAAGAFGLLALAKKRRTKQA